MPLTMTPLAKHSALALGLVIGVGYLSNIVTRPLCEREAMQDIVREMAGDEPMPVPVYVLPETARRSERALAALGVPTIRCQKAEGNFDCFPWASVHTTIAVPFILVERSEHVLFTTSGGGSERIVLGVFGAGLTLARHGSWTA